MRGAVRAVEIRGGVETRDDLQVATFPQLESSYHPGLSNINLVCGHYSVLQIWVQMRSMKTSCVMCWKSCLLRVWI